MNVKRVMRGVGFAAALAVGAMGFAGNPAGAHASSAGVCNVDTTQTGYNRVILVKGQGGSRATVTECLWNGGGYTIVASFNGYVGRNGIAAPGQKVEGDGKTPAGTYHLGSGFGTSRRPSQFAGGWTTVNRNSVWIDGGASVAAGYNTMGQKNRGARGESLYNRTAYQYAQVINYNMNPVVAGAGSGIFLHVNTGSGRTNGCVSLAKKDLLNVFKFEAGAADIQIIQ